MSSIHTTERKSLELLQTDYRRTWREYTVAVEQLKSKTDGLPADDETARAARLRAETAAADYRDARNALADWLLEADEDRVAPEGASRSGRALVCCQAA